MNQPATATHLPAQLAKFSEEAREAYLRFQTSHDPVAADIVVLAIVQDFAPRKEGREPITTDTQRLIEDLGFDSLAIAETVFFIEDLFLVKLTNDDLVSLRTVGELRSFVNAKVGQKQRSA